MFGYTYILLATGGENIVYHNLGNFVDTRLKVAAFTTIGSLSLQEVNTKMISSILKNNH